MNANDISAQLLAAGFNFYESLSIEDGTNCRVFERKNIRAIITTEDYRDDAVGRLYFEVVSNEMFFPEMIADFINEEDFFMPPGVKPVKPEEAE